MVTSFSAQTYQIGVVANTAALIEIGSNPTATTDGSTFLPANWIRSLTVTPGQNLAAITAPTNGLITSTNGTIWVTEYT